MGLFSFTRRRASSTAPIAELGSSVVALRLRGESVPAECVQVVFSESGQSRRVSAGSARGGEVAYCFHPGPYSADIVPFAAAPEMGLRTRFVIDAADPRVAQQRFDLYLFSEVPEALTVAVLAAAVEAAVQDALEQGTIELPPCTTLDEWHAFRAGLNQLLYTRFGITVDDCIPIDLGERIDYAAQLRDRAGVAAEDERSAVAAPEIQTPAAPADARVADVPAVAATSVERPSAEPELEPPADDAHALRRLFLELPVLSSGLRLVSLPPGQTIFLTHRSLLQRIALIALDVNTMPALAWAAPDQPLTHGQQQRRTRHSVLAVQTLDQAWALLARIQVAAGTALSPAAIQPTAGEAGLKALLDEADHLIANLDYHLAQRRLARIDEASP